VKWNIGDIVKDEGGNTGIVGIRWNDGDFCTIENDAAHPNPIKTGRWQHNQSLDSDRKSDAVLK
jgi:hypothetical protein